MQSAFLFSVLVTQFVNVLSQAGGSCDSGKGICIDTNVDQCYNGTGFLKTGYCPGGGNILCCEESINIPDRCYENNGFGPALVPNSYLFTLQNQGFDGHPGALVYVPTTFDKKLKRPLEISVAIHGYSNCIQNMVRPTDLGCNCTVGQDVREAYNLINQFEDAAVETQKRDASNQQKALNRLFVAAEVAYDQANDSPGKWATQNVFRNYLNELLTVHLTSIIGNYTLDDIDRIRIFSHSGGYFTIGNMAIVGGMDGIVKDLVLFDSLYADFAHFDTFVQSNLEQFGSEKLTQFRFSSLYSLTAGTYDNNVAMANRAAGWVESATNPVAMLYDNTSRNLTIADIETYSLIFKFTTLEHNDIVRVHFYDFLVGAL